MAVEQLLQRHRRRLHRMVNVRMDPVLRSRIDDSDVVQEALTIASRKLPAYIEQRPVAFYPWLRSIAWERLIDLRREHLVSQKRSVTRETASVMELPDHSAANLASCLVAKGTSPSVYAIKREVQARVRAALERLEEHDREILVLKYLERLPTSAIATILTVSGKVVRSRHRRAIERLRTMLDEDFGESNR